MRDVKGYEGLYEITKDGIIFRKERITKKSNGYDLKLKRKQMKQSDLKGYLSVGLIKNKVKKRVHVHRLVAETFIPNPDNKSQVNHINGIKTDNRVCNLEWTTPKENTQHAVKNKLRGDSKGMKNGMSKVNESDVKRMREMYKSGLSQIQISKVFNLNKDTVWKIINRKLWDHVE